MSHSALRIPEILSLVLNYTDHQTALSSALACKTWLNPALDELWRCIKDPFALFKLLGPMHVTSEQKSWIYSAFIMPSDWTRFHYYARRIRHFEYTEVATGNQVDASVLAEIARTRLNLVLLPHLKHLHWNSKHLNYATLFMHSGICQLTVSIDRPFLAEEGFAEARAFLVECATRLPNLTILDLRGSFSVVRVQTRLLGLLRSLKRLTTLILPRYWITSTVLASVADLPCLDTIQWEYCIQGEGDVKDVETFELVEQHGSFISLVDISLEIDFTIAINLFETATFPTRLTSLMIRPIATVTPTDLSNFLQLCATRCRALSTLHLELFPNKPQQVNGSHDITLETLRPLLSCLNITRFSISWPSQLCLTDNDVEELVRRWPDLTELDLAFDPYIPSPPRLTLASLISIATHCPKLQELGIYLDLTSPPPPIPSSSSSSSTIPCLPDIRNLYVGPSPISEENAKPTALFLSRLCISPSSFDLQLHPGISWEPIFQATMTPETRDILMKYSLLWKTVGEYLPMLVTLRSEELAKVRKLEREVEILRSGRKRKEEKK
ncbi:hypothetical protein BU17DRAFT_35771 [Hysterangium stoloniferum]|nr:hypothetical protein BU17DRAFT_35771 [Hysterangium stoloniferum]